MSTEQQAHSPPSDDDLTRWSPTPQLPPNQTGLQFPFRDVKAARYLMHFIHDLSPWIDICDPVRHFAVEVPKRVCDFPLLAFSILAFSSQQLCCKTGVVDPACEAYYAKALRILIPLLDDPVQSISENTLASIVILRLFEEFSDSDEGTHLLGGARILSLASTFATQGGLGEAASWVVLRQNLYVSLANSAPMRMDLTQYRQSSSFQAHHDGSFANKAVLLCCQVLASTVCAEHQPSQNQWEGLMREADIWEASVPNRFKPYYEEEASHSDPKRIFPTILHTKPAHVLGYQHFYIARIALKIFKPVNWQPSFESHQKRSKAERSALGDLRLFIGLALSNPTVTTASFTAHHALHTCGCLLDDTKERQVVLDCLEDISRSTGWRIAKLTQRLKQQWSE